MAVSYLMEELESLLDVAALKYKLFVRPQFILSASLRLLFFQFPRSFWHFLEGYIARNNCPAGSSSISLGMHGVHGNCSYFHDYCNSPPGLSRVNGNFPSNQSRLFFCDFLQFPAFSASVAEMAQWFFIIITYFEFIIADNSSIVSDGWCPDVLRSTEALPHPLFQVMRGLWAFKVSLWFFELPRPLISIENLVGEYTE